MLMLLEWWIEEKSENVSSNKKEQLHPDDIQMLETLKEVLRDQASSEFTKIIAEAEEAIESIPPAELTNLAVARLRNVLNNIWVIAESGKETMELMDKGLDCVIYEQEEERMAA